MKTICLTIVAIATLAGCARSKEAEQPTASRTRPKNINGTDDRVELLQAGPQDGNPNRMHIGRSVPAIVIRSQLTQTGSGWTLAQSGPYPFCPGERFGNQTYAAQCAASLVGDDLILTARHCIDDPIDLIPHRSVVFGYMREPSSTSTQGRTTFAADEVYHMSALVEKGIDDWALVRLDRPVHQRYRRLKIARHELRYHTLPQHATPVYSVGYGLGMPAKLSAVGYAAHDDGSTFKVSIDDADGQSGSPILDSTTHTIVGVVFQGPDDTFRDGDCLRWKVCPANTVCPIDVVKTSRIADRIPAPAGSCAGACGGQSPDGCWCDSACEQQGDCCPGMREACPFGQRSCDFVCGGSTPEGCFCDSACADIGDCCAGYFDSCGTKP